MIDVVVKCAWGHVAAPMRYSYENNIYICKECENGVTGEQARRAMPSKYRSDDRILNTLAAMLVKTVEIVFYSPTEVRVYEERF